MKLLTNVGNSDVKALKYMKMEQYLSLIMYFNERGGEVERE